jgi:peptidoglycan/LPS O-acetylase OafA/YrhL
VTAPSPIAAPTGDGTTDVRVAPVVRVESIQWLRGIAALLVVGVHAASVALDRGGDPPALFTSIPNLVAFGDSGVDLFFVISGFVMAHSLAAARDVPSFLIARWRRIWPLFVLASALFIVMFGNARSLTASALIQSIAILPLSDTTGYHQPALAVGWTLGFEMMFYLLVAATIALGRGAGTLLVLTAAAAAAGLAIAPPWAPMRMLMNPIVAEFACGIIVWLAWRADFGRSIRPLMFGIGIAILAAGIGGFIPLFVPGDPGMIVAGDGAFERALVWGVPWALVVFGLLGETGVGARTAAVLRRLGDASYSIYLFHFTVIDTLALVPPRGGVYVFVGMAFAAVIASGLLAHRWVERPLIRYLIARTRPTRPGSDAAALA